MNFQIPIMNIRKEIKEHLKKREYTKALNFLHNSCNKIETQEKVISVLKNYEFIEQEMTKNSIDSTAYYYKINQVVLDTLDITDEIIGEPDDDWDFIDDLVSSLKFNLIDQSDFEEATSDKKIIKDENGSSVEYSQSNESSEAKINEKINLLGKQLSKYEKLQREAKGAEEKVKYRGIVDAINSQIFDYLKQ